MEKNVLWKSKQIKERKSPRLRIRPIPKNKTTAFPQTPARTTIRKCVKNFLWGIGMLFVMLFSCLQAQVSLTLSEPTPTDTFYRIAFYNAENFFDCLHDSGKNDYDFTPTGIKGWGNAKYTQKRNNLFKVIAALNAIHPLVALGMAEIENDLVLRDLCMGTPLRYLQFGFIHFESPDPRGIDVALLYRKDLLRIDTAFAYPLIIPPDTTGRTRDILYVRALPLPKVNLPDTLHLFVNHFPSKYGGAQTTDHKRAAAAQLLRTVLDSIVCRNPSAFVLAMGDFNTVPQDSSLHLLRTDPYINLMHNARWKGNMGSHKFREKWSTIDHIIVHRSSLPLLHQQQSFRFDPPFLLQEDEKYMGQKPYRTFYGAKHLGGYSDHLPVYVEIKTKKPGSTCLQALPGFESTPMEKPYPHLE